MHLHGLYWSEFRQVKNCLLTVWPTTPQPFTQIFAENSAVRSCQSFCGPFSGFSRTRHSVSIVKLSWHRVFLVLDKKRKTTSIFCENGYNRKGLCKIRFSLFWCFDSLLYLFETADPHPRYRKLALQLWCLTIRVKAAGRSKVGSLEYKSYRVRCRKTGTGKRSKYRVKQPVFIEVRSIASRWESLSIARYRIWCGNSLRKKKLRTQSSVATLKSAIDWMRSPVQTRTRSLTRTTGAVSVTDSFQRLKIPLFFPCGNVNTG